MRKTLLLMASVFFSFIFIVFGYAQLTDFLAINGSASVSPHYEIQITSITMNERLSYDSLLNSVSFHGTVMNSSVTLGGQDSELVLNITVKNNTADKTFVYSKVMTNSSLENGYTNDNISFKLYEEYPNKEPQSLFYEVAPGQSKTFLFVFSYKDGKVSAQKDLSSVLTIEFIEKLTVLPGGTTEPPATTTTASTASTAPVTPPGGSTSSTAGSSKPPESTPPPAQTTAPGGDTPSAENGTDFDAVIRNLLKTDIDGALNQDDNRILSGFRKFDVVYCELPSVQGGTMQALWTAIQVDGAANIKFFVTSETKSTNATELEVFLYYAKDAVDSNLGQNILVYRQFLIYDKSTGQWKKNGAFAGYAPLKKINSYLNGNKSTLSVYRDDWIPGAIPILTE